LSCPNTSLITVSGFEPPRMGWATPHCHTLWPWDAAFWKFTASTRIYINCVLKFVLLEKGKKARCWEKMTRKGQSQKEGRRGIEMERFYRMIWTELVRVRKFS